jgi:hypothetical protein
MGMDLHSFIMRVVQDGIEGAKNDPGISRHPKRLAGSIAGFEACLGKTPEQLAQLLTEANRNAWNVRVDQQDSKGKEYDIEDYWEARYVAIQIEWVCNCVSAALMSQKDVPLIVNPTARGAMNAARILGVQAVDPTAN